MEHHSNIRTVGKSSASRTGARLRVIPMNERGELLMDEYEKMLGPRVRLVAVAHVSNALGTLNPVRRIVELAHRSGIPVWLDGAQQCRHIRVDVAELDCDFLCVFRSKMYGPTESAFCMASGSTSRPCPRSRAAAT